MTGLPRTNRADPQHTLISAHALYRLTAFDVRTVGATGEIRSLFTTPMRLLSVPDENSRLSTLGTHHRALHTTRAIR